MVIHFTRYKEPKIGQKVKTEEVCIEKNKFPISLTDDSYYVPSSEANKNIDKTKTMSHDPSLYDMPEGSSEVDFTGIAKMRKPGKDIAMLQAEAQNLQQIANEALMTDAKNKIAAEAGTKQAEREKISNIVAQHASATQAKND